jgi:ADP-ribosylglycohydrolase
LLGGAVGDSLGAAVEFDDLATIRRRFGRDGIQEPAEAHGRVGAITDDTQMTLFTAEGLLFADARRDKGTGWPPEAMIWFAYQRWLRTQGEDNPSGTEPLLLEQGELHRVRALYSRRAPGHTCLSALHADFRRLEVTPGPYRYTAANDSKGCGGVMRAAPCGLLHLGSPFETGSQAAALHTAIPPAISPPARSP